MGWKGAVRSIAAASRAAERDAKRRQRELEKQQKQFNKMQELEQAAYEVDVYENEIDLLQSIHKECSNEVDWEKVASTPKPTKPGNLREKEKNAKSLEDNYSPGFIDRLFNLEDKKRKKLAGQVTNSINSDQQVHNEQIDEWNKECEDWNETIPLAKNILDGDAKSKLAVIEKLNPFSEISSIGSSISFNITETSIVEANVHIQGNDVIPNEVKSLLKSGRLSVKKMPNGAFNELYQDYVCSCVLRVARELFSILPEEMVFVTAVDKLLNSKTGHTDISPILSVAVSRDTLKSLNIMSIDPSDSMSNFIHNMSFKKAKGFEIVEQLDSASLQCA